jgi:hypothetical protein
MIRQQPCYILLRQQIPRQSKQLKKEAIIFEDSRVIHNLLDQNERQPPPRQFARSKSSL